MDTCQANPKHCHCLHSRAERKEGFFLGARGHRTVAQWQHKRIVREFENEIHLKSQSSSSTEDPLLGPMSHIFFYKKE